MATSKIILNLSHTNKTCLGGLLNHVQRRNMPVNVPPTATGKRRFRLAVETDPHKLVNYCCGLNYQQGQEPIKLKDDSEYPEWLWTLRLGPKPNSWELEEGTKEYYLQLQAEEKTRNYIQKITAARKKRIVDKGLKDKIEYLKHIRFAALAHLEDDAGMSLDSMPQDWYKNVETKINKSDYYLPVEDRVIYMDKIEGNRKMKNFYRDAENSFNVGEVRVKPPRQRDTPAIQDSKRRHRYTCT